MGWLLSEEKIQEEWVKFCHDDDLGVRLYASKIAQAQLKHVEPLFKEALFWLIHYHKAITTTTAKTSKVSPIIARIESLLQEAKNLG